MKGVGRSSVLLALVALFGVVAMHGISGHLPKALGHAPGPAAAGGLVLDAMPAPASAALSYTGEPCTSCSPDSAAMCALIVLGVFTATRRFSGSLPVHDEPRQRVRPRNWSPDPPVPRFGLVLT